MPLFLEADGYGPGGPDNKGWNRLSLNAHFDTRHQCGLLPTNFPTLFESRTGRQRWGGYERCPKPGGGYCATCSVYQRASEHRPMPWPENVPLVLVRIRPWPPTPGSFLVNDAAGRSDLRVHTWAGRDLGITTDWRTLRNSPGICFSWFFRDDDAEAFWIVRSNPAATAALVRTRRFETHTRHALYAGQGQPRLALLTCHGCSHSDDDLQHLAADLGDAADGTVAAAANTPVLPERLAGVPAIGLVHEDGRSRIRHRDATTSISWDMPFGEGTAAALLAHAVRLACSF
ncbi:hypothetical protein [Streptomyces luteireticuli]|uniref:hypothetical protein n=1 Tax=Streptomyces luteireticuli TaxID=173858 RepID=UPI003558106B